MKKHTFISLMLLFSCAVKGPPSGGPPDLSSPYIKDTHPLNGSTHISKNENIEINFNEMIDPNSIKSSIVIIPEIIVKMNSYGKKIHIKPVQGWPENSEFKIKIKRSISDYQGNKMKSGKILTYSTSNSISMGTIKGALFNTDSLKYCTVALFKVNNNELKFYASIENDINNKFEFNNIEEGEFIIIALMHEIRNIYEDIRLYSYGLFPNKIVIDDKKSKIDNVDIYISYPSVKEKIVSINMINKFFGEILLTNNEKIILINNNVKTNFSDFSSYAFFDSSVDSLNILFNTNNYIESYKIEGQYKLNNSIIDSLPPKIADSYFKNNEYHMEFSEPIKINSNLSPFIGLNSIGDSIYFSYEHMEPKIIIIKDILDNYTNIIINNSSITDYSDMNIQLIDNKLAINQFPNTINKYGNIYGNVIYKGDNNIVVEIIDIKSKETKRVKADQLGDFFIQNVKSNKYMIWAYEDINSISDYYFNGTLDPLKLSARFGIYNEVIEIRANWDIEGIMITIEQYDE